MFGNLNAAFAKQALLDNMHKPWSSDDTVNSMTVATYQMGAPAFNVPPAPRKLDLYLVSSP
eukprot:1161677-Pelagomonas_calceolata.AAC.16